MADSAFWRNLAAQFRALPEEFAMLRADRVSIVGSDGIGKWKLVGVTTHSVQFDALARLGASQIPRPASFDLLTAWLEALVTQGCASFNSQVISATQNPDEMQLTSGLYHLPELSANFCKMLESAALQTEFEERQRNDPRNWSQFRQQYEAFRGIKELRNEPAEQIPEEFVRNTIARIRNIKPEEVTPQQINFEVAGLLSSTKRRIELIPSSASQESPVAEEKHVYVGMETTREQERPEPVQDAVPQRVTHTQVDPKTLRDSYLANFPEERIKIRDLCWAAGQHYREWKRWLAGELKNGSTPDLAFRRVLTSGKRPQELSKKPRPKGWE